MNADIQRGNINTFENLSEAIHEHEVSVILDLHMRS